MGTTPPITTNNPQNTRSTKPDQANVALEVTWSAYQNIIDAYRAPDTDVGKALMEAEINTLTSTRVPRSLTELITLGRTLKRRATDILAYFDHPHTSNGPTEAINGRLEHLRGSALGLAKPHPLHHPSTPRNRRIQTPTTPPIMKSPGGCWQLCSPDVIAQKPRQDSENATPDTSRRDRKSLYPE